MTRHCWDGGGEKDAPGFGAWEKAEVPQSNLRQQGGRRPLHSDRSASFPPASPGSARGGTSSKPRRMRRSRRLRAPSSAGPPRTPANLLPHPGAPLPPDRRTHDALGHGGRSCLRARASGCRRLSPQGPRSPGLGLSPGPGLPPPPPPPLQLRRPAPPAPTSGASLNALRQAKRDETRFRPRQRPRACAGGAARTSAPPPPRRASNPASYTGPRTPNLEDRQERHIPESSNDTKKLQEETSIEISLKYNR